MKKLLLLTVVQLLSVALFAQQIVVSGKVVDAKTSEPVIGATVIEVGTANGSITDAEGNYSFSAEAGGSIIAEMVGYTSVTEVIGNRSVINFQLEIDALNVEETVVIGYGATRKGDLSAAIATKEIGEDIKSRPGGVVSSLQGQIAGVTISSNGGDPLSESSVVIRGQGSRSGEPILYVVDGVVGAPFNNEDVVNITVLKDAASSAIYGANAGSGGVILVTTKRATTGDVKVSAKASYGISSFNNTPEMLNAEQYAKVWKDAGGTGNAVDATIYPFGQITHTDWLDEIFQTGSMQRYSVSLSGGTEKMNSYASAEYSRNEGILLNTWSESFGGKINVNFKPVDWLQVQQKLNITYTNGQGGVNTSSHTGVIASAMYMPPSATVYEVDEQGNVILDDAGNKSYGGIYPEWASDLGLSYGEVQNPVATLNRLDQYRPQTGIFSTTSFIIDPIRGLNFRSDVSAHADFGRYEDFVSMVPEIGKPNLQNSREISSTQEFGWLWDNILTYDKVFNGVHALNVMGGATLRYDNYRYASTTLHSFPDEDETSQHWVNATDWSKTKPTEEFWETSQFSLMARAAYTYDDRYFLTASIRRDAASKLYQDNNSGIFPAVSGAWKVSSEEFMQNQDLISFLKVRASWGQVGNIASVGYYSYASNFSTPGYPTFLGKDQTNVIHGLSLTTIANTDLRWETSEQTDIGFDIALFNNRLSFAADWFNKRTKDLIDEMIIPSVAGISDAPLANIGEVKNSGYEFSLGWSNETKSGFTYSVNGNVSFLDSEVISMGDREFYEHSNNIRSTKVMRSEVGTPWYSFYLIQNDGIFRSQAEIDAYTWTNPETGATQQIQPNAKPGDLKFIDYNNDGDIDANDRTYCGSYAPDITFGLNGSFAYKGWDMAFVLQGVAGNKIYNGEKLLSHQTQGWNLSADLLDSYMYNPNSDIPSFSVSDPNGTYSQVQNDYYLEDGDYVRLKNLTIGYTLPERLFGASSFKPSIRVYFSAENLATITGYTGMDPEVSNYGIDGANYPTPRTFSFGASMNF